MLSVFNTILDTGAEQENNTEIPTRSVEDIHDKEYVVALEKTPITEGQAAECCYQFLEFSQQFAEALGWPIQDQVTFSEGQTRPSVVTGVGLFTPGSLQHTTTSVSQGTGINR